MYAGEIAHISSRTKIKMNAKVLLVLVCVLILNLEGEKLNEEIPREIQFSLSSRFSNQIPG